MEFNEIKKKFENDLLKIETLEKWNEIRVQYLGKKGIITNEMKELQYKTNKKEIGKELNELKEYIRKNIEELKEKIILKERDEFLQKSEIDVTLPGYQKILGKQNILLKTKRDIEKIFQKIGFEVALGTEIETDYYNFEALNLDKNHPARDMQDTFYINPKTLLRTHTSNIQSKTLEKNIDKEFKIICPGKVYRRDDDDATHSHQFMQIEVLAVVHKDSPYSASLKDLKSLLLYFFRQIFDQKNLKVRLRPSYFPFTEPSVEVDISCTNCLGKGCSFCKQTGWIEILGAGIINPQVLEISGYDSKLFTGYAIGMGIERIALLKYKIDDIRSFYLNNNEFLNQF